jgi:hypothetical protein
MIVEFKEITATLVEVIDPDTGLVHGVMYRKAKMHEYSEVLGDIICDRMVHGEKITRICEDKNMPSYGVIQQWRKAHEGFSKNYDEAKLDRSDYYFDKVINEAEKAEETTVATAKLKIDSYKWAASVSKPSEYGQKSKGNIEIGSVIIKVDTGIVRPEDNILESRIVEELDSGGTQDDTTSDDKEVSDSGDDTRKALLD